MTDWLLKLVWLVLLVPMLLAASTWPSPASAEENLLRNATLAEGTDSQGVPKGWHLYGGRHEALRLVLVRINGHPALQIEDSHPGAEIGITQTLPAKPGETYQATAHVRAVAASSSEGAYLQLRFLPSGHFAQASLATKSTTAAEAVSVKATAPPDTTHLTIYLYTHRDPTPKLIVERVELISGVAPPPPPPSQVVPPQYTKLKDLHLTTWLVKDGKPAITIVVPASGLYADDAGHIQRTIQEITGVRVPILSDTAPEAAVPITRNLILLGNRSTHRTIEELYNRFFTLLDLRYPGPGGYEVRTLHNPFGGGHNVLFVGGSDAGGVHAGASFLVRHLRTVGGGKGSLSIGWIMKIQLGRGIRVPTKLEEFEVWEASEGYRSVGYFGWNSISKRMAMYYMTGDPFHAREALRLAFPDAKAFEEITRIDEERIENKHDPLAGPYHYNAHLMILFWDLIEESPVFTDEERLKVTNAFARQLNHRKNEGIYGLTQPAAQVGSRHGQWSAISLYCLGRYFQRDYPDPIWQQCLDGARWHFASLHEHAWVSGESDNLFWYCTGIAPIFTYLLLSGERKPVENGVLQELFRGQEILISGRDPDWALRSAALDYLHKAAYLLRSGRPLYYRRVLDLDLNTFRLGQSFWPESTLKPEPPTDLVGKWSIQRLPPPHWRQRATGFPLEESFYFGSFRSATDHTGDFILIDGYNGASRNPYHAFAILELRLNGTTVLQGYRNQVLTRADGLVEPKVAMDAALRFRDVLGQTAIAIADVPDAAYCNWRRILAQRVGRYALVVDDLTFRTTSENIEVQTLWEAPRGTWNRERGAIFIPPADSSAALPKGWQAVRALEARITSKPEGPEAVGRLESAGIVLLRATEVGSWVEMAFDLKKPFQGEVYADFLDYHDRGRVRLFLDGKPTGVEHDHYAPVAQWRRVRMGHYRLEAGTHRLMVQVVGKREGAERCNVGLAGLSLRPEGAPSPPPPASPFVVQPCDLLEATTQGGVITTEWRGAVEEGQHRLFFSLIGPEIANGGGIQCVRLAENAAALALPEPALAVCGLYEGTRAGLAVMARDHLFGKDLEAVTVGLPLVRCSVPVDLDWDFPSGVLEVTTTQETRLALATGTGLRWNGRPLKGSPENGLTAFTLPAGRHHIEGATPQPAAQQELAGRLRGILTQAARQRERPGAAVSQPIAPALPEAFSTNVGGRVVACVNFLSEQGPLIAAADGQTIHLLGPDGREVRRFSTDGPIRVLHWWPEERLLLAGCTDEKVIAFDEDGQRRWVFVSEMDPAVFEAAKQYWFKSAPGHEGIHGLYSGVFLEGKSQCFVGSACTLEILNGQGQLVKRLPVFWGPGSLFRIIDGPEGSLHLLIARAPTDGAALAVVSNKDLRVIGYRFHSVPPGATYVGGWASMSRRHLFYEDLDGDGTREVCSEINGTWNRVTVWRADGTALYDASFGPGQSIPARNLRSLDVADLDGDGKKEILVATSSGLVVVLDCQCRKVWAQRLPSPPTVLKAVRPKGESLPWIVVGCEGGAVIVLNGQGRRVRQGAVTGTPSHLEVLQDVGGPIAVLATESGEVKGLRLVP